MEMMLVMTIDDDDDDDDNYDNDHLILPGQLLARVGVQLARPWVVVGRPQRWRASADPLCLWIPAQSHLRVPANRVSAAPAFQTGTLLGKAGITLRRFSEEPVLCASTGSGSVREEKNFCLLLDTSAFSFSSS